MASQLWYTCVHYKFHFGWVVFHTTTVCAYILFYSLHKCVSIQKYSSHWPLFFCFVHLLLEFVCCVVTLKSIQVANLSPIFLILPIKSWYISKDNIKGTQWAVKRIHVDGDEKLEICLHGLSI